MKQTLIKTSGKLLDENGRITTPGYAKELILSYDRGDIKAGKSRIKEWDYYFFGNDKFGFALTIADNSYMGIVGATFFDFTRKEKYDYKRILPFTNGKFKLPFDSMEGDIKYADKKITFEIKLSDGKRELYCKIPKFKDGKGFEVRGVATYTNKDSMVIATPFKEDDKAFYYNQKINNLVFSGTLNFGEEEYNFVKEQGVLDWGRGVWTRDNTWYWSSMSALLPDGSPLGFNLGYGFGDTSAASENMVFYKGVAYKLNDVDFGIPEDSFIKPWHFTSEDEAIDMIFTPIYDNRTDINLLLIKQDAHQVFGHFSGTIKLNNKEKVAFENAFGFAEKIRNVW